MARYIKVNSLVAKYLQLESDRNSVKDGNYLLWQSDLLKFGPLTQINEILLQIGGIALMPHEAREEQDGTVTRPLPRATDSRFIMPEPSGETSEETADKNEGDMAEADSGQPENLQNENTEE